PHVRGQASPRHDDQAAIRRCPPPPPSLSHHPLGVTRLEFTCWSRAICATRCRNAPPVPTTRVPAGARAPAAAALRTPRRCVRPPCPCARPRLRGRATPRGRGRQWVVGDVAPTPCGPLRRDCRRCPGPRRPTTRAWRGR